MRRGGRPSQVRPRPPSTGRPAPIPVRARPPSSRRVTPHRPVPRSRGLPIIAKLVLAVAVAGLAGFVVYAGRGGLATLAAAFGNAVSGVVADITSTPAPSPAEFVVAGAPVLDAPAESYTNQATIDVTGTIPPAFTGQTGYVIRLYVTLQDQEPAPIREVALPITPRFTIPGVELSEGANDFFATVVGPGGESDASATVTYVLDDVVPNVVIDSPVDGATVNGQVVTIAGRTQGRAALVVRNEANGETSTAGAAASDGSFSIVLPIEPGTNGITITITDPAGNTASTVISVQRGSGKLTVSLSASAFRFKLANLPESIALTAQVMDPDGRPLDATTVTFTLSIPGLPAVTRQTTTNGAGSAVFQTAIPEGATEGGGLATAFVEAGDLGSATDRTVVTVVK